MALQNSINAPNTQYNIIVGDGTSFGLIAPSSTTGDLYISNGPSANPSFQTASYTLGDMEFLEVQTASSSSELELTAFSSYSNYLILIEGIVPATAGDSLCMEISDDGGTSYATSNYQSGLNYSAINSNTITNLNSTSYIPLTSALSTSSSVCGFLTLYNVNAAVEFSMNAKTNWIDNASSTKYFGANCAYNSLTNVDAIRIYCSTSNIVSGSAFLYGIKN